MRPRNGSALLLVLLGLVLLEVMIAGTLLIAADAIAAAGVDARSLHARLTAESAIRERLAEWQDRGLDTLATGATVRSPARRVPGGETEVEALGHGRFLIRGAAPGDGVLRDLAQVLVATIDRDSLRALFDAAVHTGAHIAIEAGATVDGAAVAAGGACADPPAPGLVAETAEIDPAAALAGAPPLAPAVEQVALPVVAGMPISALRPLADVHVSGDVMPAPGDCTGTDPLDWGDPAAAGDCAGRMPLIYADADLDIGGGTGQGTLIVTGRLRIAGGARFHGAVLARSLDLADGAIVGAVRVFGPDTSRIAGSVLFDGCTLDRVLGAPALGRPFRRGPRLWLPAR